MRRYPLPALTGTLGGSLVAAVIVAGCSTSNPTVTGAPAASGIGVSSGSAQSASVGTALTAPLIAHVTDQYGNAIAGVAVTFTATGSAMLGSTTGTTDADGDAQTTVTFANTSGLDTVTATVSGINPPARFFLTALASVAVTDSIVSGNNQTGPSGTLLPLPLAVQFKDQFGNLEVGDTVTWTATTGVLSTPADTGAVVPPVPFTTVTDSTGTAQAQFTPALGTNTITAIVAGSALIVTFTATGT